MDIDKKMMQALIRVFNQPFLFVGLVTDYVKQDANLDPQKRIDIVHELFQLITSRQNLLQEAPEIWLDASIDLRETLKKCVAIQFRNENTIYASKFKENKELADAFDPIPEIKKPIINVVPAPSPIPNLAKRQARKNSK